MTVIAISRGFHAPWTRFLFEFYILCALFQEARLAAFARSTSWKLYNVLAYRVLELYESLELLESHESNAKERERERERERKGEKKRENIAWDLFDVDKFRSIHTRPKCVNSIADLWCNLRLEENFVGFSSRTGSLETAFLRIQKAPWISLKLPCILCSRDTSWLKSLSFSYHDE